MNSGYKRALNTIQNNVTCKTVVYVDNEFKLKSAREGHKKAKQVFVDDRFEVVGVYTHDVDPRDLREDIALFTINDL